MTKIEKLIQANEALQRDKEYLIKKLNDKPEPITGKFLDVENIILCVGRNMGSTTGKKRRLSRIICLCGSTRFTREMLIRQWELTKQGFVVLGWCALPDDYFRGEDRAHGAEEEGVKEIVDEVHKRKIDISDEVFVLNIGGYIGESTRSEINYAHSIGVPVKFMEANDGE